MLRRLNNLERQNAITKITVRPIEHVSFFFAPSEIIKIPTATAGACNYILVQLYLIVGMSFLFIVRCIILVLVYCFSRFC